MEKIYLILLTFIIRYFCHKSEILYLLIYNQQANNNNLQFKKILLILRLLILFQLVFNNPLNLKTIKSEILIINVDYCMLLLKAHKLKAIS